MTWAIRIIVIVLVIRALWRLLKGILEGAGYMRVDSAHPPTVKLVRDPVCGVFVAPTGRTLVAHAHGETAYFCSEQCRREWEKHA